MFKKSIRQSILALFLFLFVAGSFARPAFAADLVAFGNLVFEDINDNGVRDAGEPGIGGVEIEIYTLDTNGLPSLVDTLTTAPDGSWSIEGLNRGSYYAVVTQENFGAGGPLSAMVSSTDVATSDDPDNNVDGDDNGVGSNISNQDIFGGIITLITSEEPTSPDDEPIGATEDANANSTYDFGFVLNLFDIGDTVWLDANNDGLYDPATEDGIAGVSVMLYASPSGILLETVVTDANGNYLFEDYPGDDYYIVIDALPGFDPSDVFVSDPDNDVDNDSNGVPQAGGGIQSGVFTLSPGDEPVNDGDTDPSTNLTLDFGFFVETVSLGNFIWEDVNDNGIQDAGEPGIEGVSVTVTNVNTGLQVATQTDANGLYLVEGLPEGTYQVTIDEDNFLTPADPLYGLRPSSTATFADDNNSTDNNGFISGDIVISTPVQLIAGEESTTDGDLDASTNLTVDFGFFAPPLSIGNQLFDDVDGDGVYDPLVDAGIGGVTIVLTDVNDGTTFTVTTNPDGTYLFGDLQPGCYSMEVPASMFVSGAPLDGYNATSPQVASADNGVDNDSNAIQAASGDAVTLGEDICLDPNDEPTGEDGDDNTNLTIDLGFVQELSVGNIIWLDANGDGFYDAGSEDGIAGVTVNLVDENGVVVATQETAADGSYLFEDVDPGDYTIAIPAAEFQVDGQLENFGPTLAGAGADANVNNDNDFAFDQLGATTDTFTLAYSTEPINDGDDDFNSNLSIDGGFNQSPTAVSLSGLGADTQQGSWTMAAIALILAIGTGVAFNRRETA